MVDVTFKYTWRVQPDGVGVVEERSSLTDRIVETRINTRDKAIVRVLESMGWASPDRHTQLVEALTELCDEIDNHDIHSAISKTNILWFKRKARAALAPHRKGGGQ